MKINNYLLLLLFAGVIGFAVQSCKSKKHVIAAAPVEEKVEQELFADIIDNQFKFKTFSSRVNLNLSSGTKSLSSKSNLRILKDQAIQLSVQPLFGVEMIRLYIDLDSIVFLDRMNKRYVKESLEDVKKSYPVGFDFKTVQSLLTNRIFVSGKSEVIYKDYEHFTTRQLSDLYYRLNSTDKDSGIEYSFDINGNDRIELAHLTEPQRKYSMDWQYEDFVLKNDVAFPHSMNVKLTTTKRKADIGLEFSNIVLDENYDLQISIPAGYTRANINDILKLITGS